MTTDEMNKRCAGCDRRDFLVKLGLLAGFGAVSDDLLAMLPPAVAPDLIPSKAGAVKVRLVFAYHKDGEVQVKPDWPNVGYDFRPVMKNITDTLNLKVRGVEFLPVHCVDDVDAAKLVDADEKAGEIKGYMFVQLNCWNKCILAWNRTKKPVFYTPLPYAGDGGWLKHNSQLMNLDVPYYASFAAFDFSKVVEVARAFEVLAEGGDGPAFKARALAIRNSLIPPDRLPEDLKVVDDRLACLSPEATLEKLRGMKILSVQREVDAKFAQEVRQTFGIELERVTFDEVKAASRAVADEAARAVSTGWAKTARRVEYVDDATLLGCAKMYLGMKAVLAKHGAQAITIDCLGGCYTGKLDAYPCLGFMQLQDDGLMGVCENDLRSTLTMLVFQALSGRTGYVSDPALDMPNRAISYAHCVSTRRFFGPQGAESPFEIQSHSEDRKGASVRAFAPVGVPVTTVLVDPGKRALTLHTGIVTGNDTDDRACRTKIVARVTGDYSKIERTWRSFSWHRVTFLGDFRADVEKLAAKIGYKVVYES